jgi:Rha family phage regulatory protein
MSGLVRIEDFKGELIPIVDSVTVADELGKRHGDVMRDIKELTNKLMSNHETKKIAESNFAPGTYKDKNNQERPMYLMTKEGFENLVFTYNGTRMVIAKAKFIRKFHEMEEKLKEQQQPKLPVTFKEALLALLAAEEEKEKLQLQNSTLNKELDHKEDVIAGLVDEISVAEKRQILNRVVKHKGADYQGRWRILYREFESKYHVDLSRRIENYIKKHGKKISKIDFIDKHLNKIPQLYEIACKIFQSDVDELINEMYLCK